MSEASDAGEILVPLPDVPYYLWQAEVQQRELIRQGRSVTYLVYTRGPRPSKRALGLRNGQQSKMQWWRDWRSGPQLDYDPAMKPWLVGRYLESVCGSPGGLYAVIDPDAVPMPEWAMPDATAAFWHASDTDSYTGSEYLQRKGVWDAMCNIFEVDPKQPMTGAGSQVVFRNSEDGSVADFWIEVALESIELFKWMADFGDAHLAAVTADEDAEEEPVETPVQMWCAEMYATQFLARQNGITLHADPAMHMVWANDDVHDLEGAAFFHDAGVTEEGTGSFCKLSWSRLNPYQSIEQIREGVHADSASSYYVDLMAEAAEYFGF